MTLLLSSNECYYSCITFSIVCRWSACDASITKFVQDWMEPIACKFKLDYVVGEFNGTPIHNTHIEHRYMCILICSFIKTKLLTFELLVQEI